MSDEPEGCSDGHCAIRKPKGMHTNAAKCYCIQDLDPEMRRRVRAGFVWYRDRRSEVEAKLAEEEQGHLSSLVERDQREECIDAVKSALGILSEWSNLYDYPEFLDEVGAVLARKDARVEEAEAELTDRREGATDAFNKIAILCGCPSWDYPGQLVRDVEAMKARADGAERDLEKASKGAKAEMAWRIEAQNDTAKARALVDDDHWAWMGDKDDDLSTMSEGMVVRITAGDMRRLIAKGSP